MIHLKRPKVSWAIVLLGLLSVDCAPAPVRHSPGASPINAETSHKGETNPQHSGDSDSKKTTADTAPRSAEEKPYEPGPILGPNPSPVPGSNPPPPPGPLPANPAPTTENPSSGKPIRVAFLGDQGNGSSTVKVLETIKAANVNLMVILGDFDYDDNPDAWDKLNSATLGENFPILAAVGNHDTAEWQGYREKLTTRLAKMDSVTCDGDYGVNMKCEVSGVTIVLSGVGTMGTGHQAFIDKSLKEAKTPWKVCAWHKNQKKMQVGEKSDEVGWPAYESCRENGAIIATGHEHSYERTYLLSSMQNQTIASKENNLVLEPGKTFAFVSGLGGTEVRDQKEKGDYWAKIYTSTQNATFGVMICDFNVDNNPRKAHCQFKNIKNEIIDDFTLESKLP